MLGISRIFNQNIPVKDFQGVAAGIKQVNTYDTMLMVS